MSHWNTLEGYPLNQSETTHFSYAIVKCFSYIFHFCVFSVRRLKA